MKRRHFFQTLAGTFAAIAAMWTEPDWPSGGIVDSGPKPYLVGEHCSDAADMFGKHSPLMPVQLTKSGNEPRVFTYPFGNVPWKQRISNKIGDDE
jgi:hypothetical protein